MLAGALFGCATPHVDLIWPGGNRPPNDHEMFYTAVAASFGDAKMCPLIYPRAIEESCGPDMACTDWRVAYEKSACFFYAGLKSRTVNYCDSVESITVLPSNKSEITSVACKQVIKQGGQYGYWPGPNPYSVGMMLSEMGYREEGLDSLAYSGGGNNDVHRFYDKVRENEGFKAKVEDLPDYSEPLSEQKVRPANNDELLMEAVAYDDGLYALCGKISPNAYYHPAYPGSSGRLPLRDECFDLASKKTGSSKLCEAMAPAGALSITPKYTNRQGCESWIQIQNSRHINMGGDEDGVVFFPTRGDFVAALQKVGYANPYLSDGASPNWMAFYQAMEFGAYPEERDRFLKRAEGLPKFTK
jgi:hypothetical protein